MYLLLLGLVLLDPQVPQPTNIVVHDGDTIYVDFQGVPTVLGKNLGVRLLGIDTPELRDPDPAVKAWAYKARDYLRARVANAKTIRLDSLSRDKYYRLDAKLIIDGVDIQKEMLEKKFAKPYDGGTKSPWTVKDIPVR